MYKLYSYWSAPKPEVVEDFEEYYATVHCPKAEVVPNLAMLRECSGTMIERFGVSLTVEAGEEVIADLPKS